MIHNFKFLSIGETLSFTKIFFDQRVKTFFLGGGRGEGEG